MTNFSETQELPKADTIMSQFRELRNTQQMVGSTLSHIPIWKDKDLYKLQV